MRYIYFSLTLAVLLSGCAAAKPYRRPPQGTSVEERQKIYDQQSVSYDAFWGYRIGGKLPDSSSLTIYDQYAEYFESSGDSASAALVRKANPYAWTGFTTGLVSLVAAVALSKDGNLFSDPWGAGALGVGLGTNVVLLSWGNHRFFAPAIKEFNANLKQDLGLASDTTATGLSPVTSTASPAGPPQFMDQPWFAYWGFGEGATWVPDDPGFKDSSGQAHRGWVEDVGIYRKFGGRKTIFGLVEKLKLFSWADGSQTLVGTETFVGYSLWRSLQGELGEGAFARVDLGLAYLAVHDPSANNPSNHWGWGGSIGTGYLFSSGLEHRYSITLLYSPVVVGPDLLNAFSLVGGILW